MYKLKKVTVVPILIGALVAVFDMYEKYTGNVNIRLELEVTQKAALLGTAGQLRNVLSIQGLERKYFFGTLRNNFKP